MARVNVSNHAVEKYRERALKDAHRHGRSDSEIRGMLVEAVIFSKQWAKLEGLAQESNWYEHRLTIEVFDDDGFLTTGKVVLSHAKKLGRAYIVKTYLT